MTNQNLQIKVKRGFRRSLVVSVLLLSLVLASVPATFAQGISSARSLAMGAGAIALARGVDAARFNPANLGFSANQLKGVELVGAGANISNNSFTLSDYNKYTGAFLTDDDKEDILDKVSDEGLELRADAEATALGIALGPIVFGLAGNAVADVSLNKDLLELVLNGNTYADTIEITGSYSEVLAYGSAYLSYGHSVYKSDARELALGATIKYLRGFGVERIVELEGLAATYSTGFTGEGRMIARTATGGYGYAVDLGAALKLNDDYMVGARIKNFLSSLRWNSDTEEHGFTFSFDTMTIDNMDEDYVETDDYSVAIDDFSTNLPSLLNLGVANTSGKLLWAVDWEQGFRRETGVSSKPRISAGVEYSPLSSLPLRAGYSLGGDRNASFSIGSGFHLAYFYMDYAFVTGTTFSGYSSKGLNLAITTGLCF
ncbi:MAG: hypothetical protein JSU74_13745 [Candidatus Zixiibacteriota bacterium]|nr:MAG: hypothetical protein JSU74_13745 [candidate division Zixibacteria bacterium]